MIFIDLAWSAFIYRALGSDKDYVKLMSDEEFLNRLRTRPGDVNTNEFNSKVKLFLSQWRCRVSNEVGKKILRFIRNHRDLFNALRTYSLESLDEEGIKCTGMAYSEMRKIPGVGPAICAKTLHVLNPAVFMPWDNPILNHFKRQTHCRVNDNQQGYSEFQKHAQQAAKNIELDFRLRGINSCANQFLSTQLHYSITKSIAKYIDEYYWVTITNKFDIPPIWNPTLMGQ